MLYILSCTLYVVYIVIYIVCCIYYHTQQAVEQFKAVEAKEQELRAELEQAQQETATATQQFTQVRSERHQLFTRAFEAISRNIDVIYKQLTSR